MQEGGISGLVWEDINVSKTLDTPESGYEGITVNLYIRYGTAGQTLIETTQTLENGTYSFTDLPPDRYTIEIIAPTSETWYITTTGENVKTNPFIRTVTLAPGGGSIDNDFGLVRPMYISGKVWQDKGPDGGDGIYDDNHDELLNTTLKIVGLDPWCDYTTAADLTVVNGDYTTGPLVPGRYQISLPESEYQNFVLTNSFVHYVGTDGEVSFYPADNMRKWEIQRYSNYNQQNTDFALSNRSVIRGIVWHDLNADGILDPENEHGLENIPVTIYKSTDGTTFTEIVSPAGFSTNADGAYMFSDCEANTYYKVVLTLPTPQNTWGVTNVTVIEGLPLEDTEKRIHIERDGITKHADFGLSQYIEITGKVWTELDGDGLYVPGQEGDEPAFNQPVLIERYLPMENSDFSKNTLPVLWRESDDAIRGFLQPYMLPIDTKTLYTDHNGRYELTFEDKMLPGDIKVHFSMVDNDHVISLDHSNPDRSGLTYSLNGMMSGDHMQDIDMAFTPARTVEGSVWHDKNFNGVKDEDEEWLSNIEVYLTKKNSEGEYVPVDGVLPVQTDAEGKFIFSKLPTGAYRATVVANGYFRTNAPSPGNYDDFELPFTFGIRNEIPDDIQIGLVMPSKITGKVFNVTSQSALVSHKVDLYKKDATDNFVLIASVLTDQDGNFSFDKLLLGEYELKTSIPADYQLSTNSDSTAVDGLVTVSTPVPSMGMTVTKNVNIAKIEHAVPTPTPTQGTGGTPGGVKTGDNNNTLLLTIIFISFVAVIIVSLLWMRRNNQKKSDPKK